jgi:formate dehydrogenase subunit delta
MSPDKLIYQANQIATFFASQPPEEGPEGVATHINKFWEPRMRRQFFEMIEGGESRFHALVVKAVPMIRRPHADPDSGVGTGSDAERGAPGGKGTIAGESKSEPSVPESRA